MKVKAEDILKPGAVLRTEKIDFSKDSEAAKLFRYTRMMQRQTMKMKEVDPKSLYLIINI